MHGMSVGLCKTTASGLHISVQKKIESKKNCMLRLHAYILAHVFDARVIMYFYQDHNSPLSRRCIEIDRDL